MTHATTRNCSTALNLRYIHAVRRSKLLRHFTREQIRCEPKILEGNRLGRRRSLVASSTACVVGNIVSATECLETNSLCDRFAIAPDLEVYSVTCSTQHDLVLKIVRCLDSTTVYFKNHVANVNTGSFCSASLNNLVDVDTTDGVQPNSLRRCFINTRDFNTDVATLNLSVVDQIERNTLDHVNRNCKAIAVIESRIRCDCCVDTNQAAV